MSFNNPISPIQSLGTVSVPIGETYGTTFSNSIVGGYMQVNYLSDLIYSIPSGQTGTIEYSGNTIPINFIKGTGSAFSRDVLILNSDNLSSGRKKIGMLVYVYEEDQVYQFHISGYTSLWNAATASTGTVTISDFGTTINNSSTEGQAFINAWSASTIEDVDGYTSETAVWRKFNSGTGGGGSGFTSVRINNVSQFTSGTNSYINFSGNNVSISYVNPNTLVFSAGTGGSGGSGVTTTGGTYNYGTATFTNSSGGTFNVTGFTKYFVTGSTPTGYTLVDGDRWFDTNSGLELVWITDGDGSQWVQPTQGGGGSSTGDYLPLSGGTVTGLTNFTAGLKSNTISATTYQNLPGSSSSNCFTTFYTSSISGCSPITILSPLYVTQGINVTGGTILDGLTATTISATTYYNLPFSGTVGGTGNSNYVTKWSNGIDITDSLIYDDSSFVGINTTAPIYSELISFQTSNRGITIDGLYIQENTNGSLAFATGFDYNSWGTAGGEIAIGTRGPLKNSNGSGNIGIGDKALESNTTGTNNIAIGGTGALTYNLTGSDNIAIGNSSLLFNDDGLQNVAIGNGALFNNITGDRNTVLGNDAGYSNLSNYNVYIGHAAGYSNDGSNNIFIGYGVAGTDTASSYKLNIGDTIIGDLSAKTISVPTISATTYQNLPTSVSGGGTTSYIPKWTGSTGIGNSIIYDTGTNIGIGLTNPGYKLEVRGGITASGPGNLGTFLAIDTSVGGATVALNAQLSTGIAQLVTYSNSPIVIATNSTERIRITNDGNFGIGIPSPSQRLHVSGNTLISGGLTATTISATTYLNLPSITGLYLPLSGGTVTGNTTFTSGLTVNYIDFDTTPNVPAPTGGTLYFDSTENALSYKPITPSNDVTVNLGQESLIRIYNDLGFQINNGQALHITGATSGSPTVSLAIGTGGDEVQFQISGIATHDIPDSSFGFMTYFGIVRDLNLTGFTVGEQIYLSQTVPGGFSSYSGLSFTGRTCEVGHILDNSASGKIQVSILNEIEGTIITTQENNILAANNSSTGVFEFSGLSITTPSGTTFNVGAVEGWIIDNVTSPTNPTIQLIIYPGATGITATNVTSATETYILLTSGLTITQQTTFPTPQQRRQNLYLGKFGHANKQYLINAFNEPDSALSPVSQLRDMFTPIKLINEGIYPSANGANLNINTSAGVLYGLGLGYITNKLNPNSLSISGTSPCTFQYRTRTGGTASNTTLITPGVYDNNGVVTAVGGGSNSSTNQRIYLVQNGQFRIQYGQQVYGSLAAAIEASQNETFTTFSNFRDNAILIGILSVNKNATNLSDTTQARFLLTSKFGETVGAAGGISTTNLQQAYNNSATPEIVTNLVEGALSIKNGTGNADNVTNLLEGQNTAGTTTSFIRADGAISGTSISATTFIGDSITLSNSASTISLNNATQQQIRFFSGGTGAPTYNTYSAGAKIILSDNIDSISSGYAIGVDAGSLWYGADLAGNGHDWYAGTGKLMSLASSSGLELVGLGGPTTTTMTISGTSVLGSKGGVGYIDFLKVVNNFSGATNPNKWFRVNSTGGIEILNSVYTATILTISDNGIITINSPASVTSNSATNNAINVGSKGQLFDDGNFHIHSSTGSVWINALDGSAIRLGTQTNSGTSPVIVDTSTVGHSFFTKAQTGFDAAFGTEVTMDNLKVRINGTGGSGGLVQGGAVSGTFAAYTTLLGNVAGFALQGDTNSGGITFTTTYQNISSGQKTLSAGGDTTTLHLIDTTNSRIYRITAIHCQSTTGGYISIERMS